MAVLSASSDLRCLCIGTTFATLGSGVRVCFGFPHSAGYTYLFLLTVFVQPTLILSALKISVGELQVMRKYPLIFSLFTDIQGERISDTLGRVVGASKTSL